MQAPATEEEKGEEENTEEKTEEEKTEEEKTAELWQRLARLMTEVGARDKTIAEQAALLESHFSIIFGAFK